MKNIRGISLRHCLLLREALAVGGAVNRETKQ